MTELAGRKYFESWVRRLRLEDGDSPRRRDLRRGPDESPVGGRITRDLTQLSPEETARRRALSEEFLKQPVEHVPAEEESGEDDDPS